MKTNLKLTDSQMIDLLGGTVAVAKKLRLSPSAITQWKLVGIPLNRLVFLAAEIEKQSHGLVTRQDMFPKLALYVWPELVPKNNSFVERI